MDEAPKAPAGLAVGDTLDVALFDGCKVKLTLLEQTPSVNGGDSFLATADGYDGMFVAAVVCLDGRIHIDIQDFLSGRVYSVLSSSEQTVVMEVDSRSLPCGCGKAPEAPRKTAPPGTPPVSRMEKASRADMSMKAGPAFVDILVVYDALAAEWAKKRGGGVNAFAEVQVQKMNAALANTELDRNFRFRLVGTYEVGGSAGGSIGSALEAAQSGIFEFNGVSWNGVHVKRDETGADIVCVLVDNGMSADVDNCGPQYFGYSSGYYFTGDDGEAYHTIMGYSSDGYGNYYSPAPYQRYILWSGGPNGKTFPPWVSRDSLGSKAKSTVGSWTHDDIVHMSN